MSYIPKSDSVVGFQSDPTKLQVTASVAGAIKITNNSSSSIATVRIVDEPMVSSMIALVTDTIIHGKTSAGGGAYVEVKVDPSGAIVTTASSVVTFQGGTRITSLVSTIPSSVIVGASVFGNVGISGTPNVNTAGSVVAFQSNPSVLQMLAGLMSTNASIITVGGATGNSSVQVLNFPLTQNVSGSVASQQIGTHITSLVSTVPSSVIVGTSIFGQLPAGSAPIGSVATLQGTNPWVVVGSVLEIVAPTGTVTSVQATSSTTNLLASNSSRRGATIGNYSDTSILVKLGNMANSADRTLTMADGSYYEVPFMYSGVIQHFASSTAGFIKVTELT